MEGGSNKGFRVLSSPFSIDSDDEEEITIPSDNNRQNQRENGPNIEDEEIFGNTDRRNERSGSDPERRLEISEEIQVSRLHGVNLDDTHLSEIDLRQQPDAGTVTENSTGHRSSRSLRALILSLIGIQWGLLILTVSLIVVASAFWANEPGRFFIGIGLLQLTSILVMLCEFPNIWKNDATIRRTVKISGAGYLITCFGLVCIVSGIIETVSSVQLIGIGVNPGLLSTMIFISLSSVFFITFQIFYISIWKSRVLIRQNGKFKSAMSSLGIGHLTATNICALLFQLICALYVKLWVLNNQKLTPVPTNATMNTTVSTTTMLSTTDLYSANEDVIKKWVGISVKTDVVTHPFAFIFYLNCIFFFIQLGRREWEYSKEETSSAQALPSIPIKKAWPTIPLYIITLAILIICVSFKDVRFILFGVFRLLLWAFHIVVCISLYCCFSKECEKPYPGPRLGLTGWLYVTSLCAVYGDCILRGIAVIEEYKDGRINAITALFPIFQVGAEFVASALQIICLFQVRIYGCPYSSRKLFLVLFHINVVILWTSAFFGESLEITGDSPSYVSWAVHYVFVLPLRFYHYFLAIETICIILTKQTFIKRSNDSTEISTVDGTNTSRSNYPMSRNFDYARLRDNSTVSVELS